LKPSIIRNDDEMESNPNLYRRTVALYMYIPIFVMNRIPSDIYRVKNPKLEIKQSKATGYKYVKSSQIAAASNNSSGTKQESS